MAPDQLLKRAAMVIGTDRDVEFIFTYSSLLLVNFEEMYNN